MPFATLGDVKRVLGVPESDTSQDEAITKALEAADEYVRRKLRRTFSATPTTQTFWHVRAEDVLLVLNDEISTVTSVVDETGTAIPYNMVRANAIRLDVDGTGFDTRVYSFHEPDEVFFKKVVVTFQPISLVPAPIREATALIAGEFSPNHNVKKDAAGNITPQFIQEKIGDYGYMTSDKYLDPSVTGDKVKKAMWLLRPYFKRRVFVVPR